MAGRMLVLQLVVAVGAEKFRVAYVGSLSGSHAPDGYDQFSQGFLEFFAPRMAEKSWTVDGEATTMEVYAFDLASAQCLIVLLCFGMVFRHGCLGAPGSGS